MMGFQLFADEENRGALDLYSECPYGLTVEPERKAWIFASHASVALAGVRHGKREEQDILQRSRSGPGPLSRSKIGFGL